jgi:hypothetical protein
MAHGRYKRGQRSLLHNLGSAAPTAQTSVRAARALANILWCMWRRTNMYLWLYVGLGCGG